jgi:NAD(P)-dependent dehydrogenase (short-subunit alcohol dehydrogenase family)
MTTMAVIGITGATDGIGRAPAQVLLAGGHRVAMPRSPGAHARSRERGEPILQALAVVMSLCSSETWRGSTMSIDWLTKSASAARSSGCTTAGVWEHTAHFGGRL